MKLKEGKCYVMRDGTLTAPLEWRRNAIYPEHVYYDPLSGNTYMKDGSYLRADETTPDDIVAEIRAYSGDDCATIENIFAMLDNFKYSDDPREARIEKLEIELGLLRRAQKIMEKA